MSTFRAGCSVGVVDVATVPFGALGGTRADASVPLLLLPCAIEPVTCAYDRASVGLLTVALLGTVLPSTVPLMASFHGAVMMSFVLLLLLLRCNRSLEAVASIAPSNCNNIVTTGSRLPRKHGSHTFRRSFDSAPLPGGAC